MIPPSYVQSVLTPETLVTLKIHLVFAKWQDFTRQYKFLHSPSSCRKRMAYIPHNVGHVDLKIRHSLFSHWKEEDLEFAADALHGCEIHSKVFG